MAIQSMQDLFVHGLRDIYHAESQLTKALPKMARKAASQELRQALENHLEETRGQIERLQKVFEQLDLRTRGVRCAAMEGLIEEGQEVMDEVKDPQVLDAGMLVAAQKVEHYEIASYGSLRTMAQQLGMDDAARLLEETLEEEKKADALLNEIALRSVNREAAEQGGESADEEIAGKSGGKSGGARANARANAR